MRRSSAATSCSAASSRRSCIAKRNRWCSFILPSSASTSSARLRRSCPLARAAISWADALPSIRAFSIARPDTPKTSLATLASLMLAVSSSFSSRLRSAAWLSISLRRYRSSSRKSRSGAGGTKLLAIRPCRTRSAIHSASFTSVLRPGTLRMRRALPQRFEVPRHCAKRAHLFARSRAGQPDQKTRHHRLLMHVQAAAPLNDHLRPRLLPSEDDRDAAGTVETLPCVFPVPGGDKEWYLYAARAGLLIGVASHRRDVSLDAIVRREARRKRLAPPPFSFIVGRRRRCWLAA